MKKYFSCIVNLKKYWFLKIFISFQLELCHFTIANDKSQFHLEKWRLLLICVTIAFLVPDVIFLFSKVKYVIKSLTYGTVIYLWLTDTVSIQMYTHNILLWKLRPSGRISFTSICSLFTILFSVQKDSWLQLVCAHSLWMDIPQR